jgi:Domain of unknown function (DUF4145)
MTDDMRSPCNTCARETAHEVVFDQKHSYGRYLEIRTFFIRCRGCGEFTTREETSRMMEAGPSLEHIRFSPPRRWARVPQWLATIEESDPDLCYLLEEVYSATHDQQHRLLSMGVRAALDHVMTRILEVDAGPFERKLEMMVQQGHLTERQRESLEVVIDAGSAASHRGYRPPRQLLEEMVSVMESIIRQYYISGPMLDTAKTLIPPRPTRK